MASGMSRRDAIRTLAAAAIGGAAGLSARRADAADDSAAGPSRRPNIIFILADDLGYGDLGCYGQEVIQTPNLDRMAAEGLRFTDCYAGSTVCAPSRCALMTGLHTGHCHVRGNALVPLRPEDLTVAEVLKQAGYATGIFGKWGLGEPGTTGLPNRKGFDEWFGYLNQGHAHNYYPEYLWRNEQKVFLEANKGGARVDYSHDLFSAEALDFVRRHRDHPFFLYLAYTIPHANNEYGRETGNGMDVPTDMPYSDRPWPQPQKNHAAMISRLDDHCGQLLRLLADLALDDNTIVFFTSDNGPHKEGGADPAFFRSSGPLRGFKRDLYEGGIRVPMIVRWPGTVRAGTQSAYPWAFSDFLPTAAALAGVSAPEGLDGVSVLPAILGREQQDQRYLYWEFHERGFDQALRLGQWKAVRHGTQEPVELYDLSADLGEQHDVAPQHPDVVARAERLFREARTDSALFPIREKKKPA